MRDSSPSPSSPDRGALRVLVLDGDTRAALAVTRSLGRLGHHLLVGSSRGKSLARASRYCAEAVVYPDPATASAAFLDALVGVVESRAVDVLVAVSDVTTFLVAEHRHRFSCRLPLADWPAIERAADKVSLIETARRLGIPVPEGTVLRSRDGLDEGGVRFPVVVKPWRSRVCTAEGWRALSVSHAGNLDELIGDLRARPDCAFPLLLQERIEGPGIGVFACFDSGRPVALFSHRRLRECPPWGGVSVLCESIPVDSRAGDHATRLLAELGWQGPAMVEFKQDQRDGELKLMEVNGRFWGSLQLATDAGIDFPAITIQTLEHGPFPPQPPYRVGIRSRWLWGDVDALLLTLRHSRRPGWSPSVPRPAAALRDFLKFWGPALYYDNPKWDDPWPWLEETRARLAMLIHTATGGRLQSSGRAPVVQAR